MHIGVNVDASAKIQLITTQSMPEGMSEHLKINVSLSMIKKLTFFAPYFTEFFSRQILNLSVSVAIHL